VCDLEPSTMRRHKPKFHIKSNIKDKLEIRIMELRTRSDGEMLLTRVP